jgi:hypothetical protein
LYIRLGVAISTLIFIVVVAFFPYERNINRLYYFTNTYKDLAGIKAFLIRIITEGGGNSPNIIVILIYCALKTQRHRAFLHVLFYQAQYFLIGTLRQNYVEFGGLPYMVQTNSTTTKVEFHFRNVT